MTCDRFSAETDFPSTVSVQHLSEDCVEIHVVRWEEKDDARASFAGMSVSMEEARLIASGLVAVIR